MRQALIMALITAQVLAWGVGWVVLLGWAVELMALLNRMASGG